MPEPVRFWSDLTSRALAALDPDRVVAVLPVAATEQHGPHLPLSTDATILGGIVGRLAERLPEESGVLFLPLQAVGKSNEHVAFPGTLTHSAETLIRIWCELGEAVARAGVRKMVLLNSHGGNVSVMDVVARELRVRHGMLVFAVNWFGVGLPEGVYAPDELRHGIHAGEMETSVMLALNPGRVEMDRAAAFRPLSETWERSYRHIGLQGAAKPAWMAHDLHPEGACGDAAAATAEKGRATLAHAVDRLVEVFSEIDRAPLDWVAPRPAR